MLRYSQIAENEAKLLALSGLTRGEFEALVPVFASSFETIVRTRTMTGLDRVGRAFTSYRNRPLPPMEDTLLFILVYLKQAPTQTLHGQLFGLSQSNANKWIHLLHAVLNDALATAGALPSRAATIGHADAISHEPALFSMMGPNDP